MKMKEIVQDLGAKGDCLTQFAKFIDKAETNQLWTLAHILRSFNKELKRSLYASNIDFDDLVIRTLIERQVRGDHPELEWPAARAGQAFLSMMRCCLPEDLDALANLFNSVNSREQLGRLPMGVPPGPLAAILAAAKKKKPVLACVPAPRGERA